MRFNFIYIVYYLCELVICCIFGKEVFNFRIWIRVLIRVFVMIGFYWICVGVGVVVVSMVGCRESWLRGCCFVWLLRFLFIIGFFCIKVLVLFFCKYWVFNSCWWDERCFLGFFLFIFCILVVFVVIVFGSIWFESWVLFMFYDMCFILMVL